MSLQFTEREFQPVILGANLNSYSLAREFHEKYNLKSIVLGKFVVTQIIYSQILEFIKVKDFENEDVVVREVNKLAERFSNRKIILLGCSDTLLKVIMKNKSNFKANVIAPYIDIDQAEQLMNKEEFYKLADKHGIPYPKSFIHEKSLGQSYELGFDFPVVLKPADQPLFFSKKFYGQKGGQ
jgi:D-aspartate ligase